jgi:hypothetical protein
VPGRLVCCFQTELHFRDEEQYRVLNGQLPWQLERLFRNNLLNKDTAFVECWLALLLTTMPDNLGNLDPFSTSVKVTIAPVPIGLQDFSVGNIVGCTHGIPERGINCMTRDGTNKQWIVNSHIDLPTWNALHH